MERLANMMSRGQATSGSTASSSNTSSSRINKEVVFLENIDKELQNWNLPSTSVQKIYKTGSFNFRSDFVIKTVEETIPLTEGYDTFYLLSQKLLNAHKQKYRYLHLGMVQIGLKPLTRLGLDSSALIMVRDQRHNKFEDSLLGIVESTLCDGPIHFECYPNFTLSLSDPTIIHALTLNIKTHGFDMMQGAENVALVYRLCYKVMNTIAPKTRSHPELIKAGKGHTTLFLTNLAKSNVAIPRNITWSEVTLPETWKLQEAVPPKREEPRTIEKIVQYVDGDIEIRFSQQRKIRLNIGEESRRHSVSSLSEEERINIIGLNTTEEQVSQPQYTVETPKTAEERTPSKRFSPTMSEMGYNIMTLQKGLDIPSKRLQRMIDSEKNDFKRKWFLISLPLKKQQFYINKYMEYVAIFKTRPDFFLWLEEVYEKKGKEFPDFENERYLAVLEASYQSYITIGGNTIQSQHPPETSLIIKRGEKEAIASPYKGEVKDEILNQIVQQNNYTNMYLQSIGKQTTRIESLIVQPQSQKIEKGESQSRDSVMIKPPPSIKPGK